MTVAKRRSVMLAKEIEKFVREYQARLLVNRQRDVSFNDSLNYLMAMAITRKECLAIPVLSPEEIATAKELVAGTGVESAGLFDYVPDSTGTWA